MNKTELNKNRKIIGSRMIIGFAILCIFIIGLTVAFFFFRKDQSWKTEECYSRMDDGELYLSSLTEYNEQDDVIRKVLYNADGSVKQESRFENEYSEERKLVKASEFRDSELFDWWQYEYDDEGRMIKRSHYDKDGGLRFEEPYSYVYDETAKVLYCEHMGLSYDENGEYIGSGFSNHEVSSYDEENRLTAYYAYPITAQCHMYNQTEAQIRQRLREITMESENPVYCLIAQMIDEYGEEVLIEVYRYDGDGNLQEVDSYNAVTESLNKKMVCTYEYDNKGRVRKSLMESESERGSRN